MSRVDPVTGHAAGPRARRARWVVAGAVAAGIAVRLAFGFLYWTGKPLTLDEQEYLLLARALAAGEGYRYGADAGAARHFDRPPAYPLFLSAALMAAGEARPDRPVPAATPPGVKVVQSLIGGAAVALIALVAGRAAGRRAAAAAAWLAAFYPPLVWISAYVLTEALYVVLAFLAVWLLSLAVDAVALRARWPALLAGLAVGAGVLTREATVFFLLLVGAWLLWTRRVVLLLLFVGGAAAVVLPWIARNYAVHGAVVLDGVRETGGGPRLAPHGGVTFWTGNNALARGEGDLAANPRMKQAQIAFEERHRALSNAQRDSLYYREAMGYIARHPIAWLGLEAKKIFYTVVPIGPSYRLHSTKYLAASLVSYLVLLPFGVAGAVALFRRRRLPAALWLLAASAVLASLAFFPQERFRIPVIDPALIVCAAGWWALQRGQRARRGEAGV